VAHEAGERFEPLLPLDVLRPHGGTVPARTAVPAEGGGTALGWSRRRRARWWSTSSEDAGCEWRLTWQISDLGRAAIDAAVPRASPLRPVGSGTQRAWGRFVRFGDLSSVLIPGKDLPEQGCMETGTAPCACSRCRGPV
jgi:hypothetical protein